MSGKAAARSRLAAGMSTRAKHARPISGLPGRAAVRASKPSRSPSGCNTGNGSLCPRLRSRASRSAMYSSKACASRRRRTGSVSKRSDTLNRAGCTPLRANCNAMSSAWLSSPSGEPSVAPMPIRFMVSPDACSRISAPASAAEAAVSASHSDNKHQQLVVQLIVVIHTRSGSPEQKHTCRNARQPLMSLHAPGHFLQPGKICQTAPDFFQYRIYSLARFAHDRFSPFCHLL